MQSWPFTRQRGGVAPSPVESEGLTDALEMEILKVGCLRWMTLRTSGYKECCTRDIFVKINSWTCSQQLGWKTLEQKGCLREILVGFLIEHFLRC